MSAPGVCPTEDAIHALLDYLVEPMLPAKSSSRENPPEALLQSVAKQVLLKLTFMCLKFKFH